MKKTGMTWSTQVSHCDHGNTTKTWPAWSEPSACNSGAAISQWPRTTTRIDTARQKSTVRLRRLGVRSATSPARRQAFDNRVTRTACQVGVPPPDIGNLSGSRTVAIDGPRVRKVAMMSAGTSDIREQVPRRYAATAVSVGEGCCGPVESCGPDLTGGPYSTK